MRKVKWWTIKRSWVCGIVTFSTGLENGFSATINRQARWKVFGITVYRYVVGK